MISPDEIIGKVIRRTRLQDTSWIRDMYVWINEAANIMRTKYELVNRWGKIRINFHKGALPSTVAIVDAVMFGGVRVANSMGALPLDYEFNPVAANSSFLSLPGIDTNPVTGNNMYTGIFNDVDLAIPVTVSNCHSYWITGNCINFSEAEAEITIFCRMPQTDNKGHILLPNLEAHSEACYWNVRKRMIEAGYKDKVFNWDKCDQQFTKFATRAIESGLLETIDEMEIKYENIQGRFEPTLNNESWT